MYKIELTVETEEQKDQILELLRENEEDGVLDFAFNTLVSDGIVWVKGDDKHEYYYQAEDALMEQNGGRAE